MPCACSRPSKPQSARTVRASGIARRHPPLRGEDRFVPSLGTGCDWPVPLMCVRNGQGCKQEPLGSPEKEPRRAGWAHEPHSLPSPGRPAPAIPATTKKDRSPPSQAWVFALNERGEGAGGKLVRSQLHTPDLDPLHGTIIFFFFPFVARPCAVLSLVTPPKQMICTPTRA